ncbi:MAG: hypothetical protein RL596_601 [Bacteroidota bacterium]
MFRKFSIYLSLLIFLFSACKRKTIPESGGKYDGTETGNASYYADKFEGRKTANGETFNQSKLTAAHKKLPFGTQVLVTSWPFRNRTNN